MSSAYIDKVLLNTASLSKFPEIYAFIHECEHKPFVDGIANQIFDVTQYLRDQVIDSDNKLNMQPAPQPIIPTEMPQVQIFKIPKNQLAAKIQYIFNIFLEDLYPFSRHALVLEYDVDYKQNVMRYIESKGFYIGVSIGSVDQITSIKENTHIAIAGVYYKDFEPLKRATSEVNDYGKINIVDDMYVNLINDRLKSMSWVQDDVQKQTQMIGDGVQPYDPSIPVSTSNYFNISSKLVNNNTFVLIRAAHFVKQAPIFTFNFQGKFSRKHVNNVIKVFKLVDFDLQS
ncbi:MAG: hypothetical protein EZS28_036908 [Streblomastix strix]|uniref:Uncharacterized protein n=1 Tax=Streblomastix strix TaxID=222440 RepID=A0A5J4UDA1_9EUKA|nr:MAG: hypothetical protein EZS28_036908 [Streblomastix strix]